MQINETGIVMLFEKTLGPEMDPTADPTYYRLSAS